MTEKRDGLLTSSANLINALGSFMSKAIWSFIGLIVIATGGRFLMASQYVPPVKNTPKEPARVVTVEPGIPWHDVDAKVRDALETSFSAAEAFATARLDGLTGAMEQRVDSDFLEWYFGYWNQQWLGIKGMGYWAAENVFENQPSMAERITGDIQEEFSKRVLRPEITQMQLERITDDTLRVYVETLQANLETIPGQYQIPQADWDRYLEDIAVLTAGVEGNRSISLSLKAVTASVGVGTVAGAALTVKLLRPAMAKVGTRFASGAAAEGSGVIAAVATKTGAKVGAKAGGKFLGPIIGVGIIVWDVWDHNHTKGVEKPILRENIVDYLAEMRESLLHDPETGIMSIIGGMEAQMIGSLPST